MSIPHLSRKAEEFLDKKLQQSGLDYLTFLASWKNAKVPEFEEVVIKNQGILDYLKSKEEYDIVVELINFAIITLENRDKETFPKPILLSDFLDIRMKNMAKLDRAKIFKEFLIRDLEATIDVLRAADNIKGSREDFLREKQKLLRQRLDADGLPEFISEEVAMRYHEWAAWHPANKLLKANLAVRRKKHDRKETMLSMLSISNRANEGITKTVWKRKAHKLHDIPPDTFDKYYRELSDQIEISGTGKIRRKVKASEKK
jgi:hypothetical protein